MFNLVHLNYFFLHCTLSNRLPFSCPKSFQVLGGNVTCSIIQDGLGKYEQMKHNEKKTIQQKLFLLTKVQGLMPYGGADMVIE